MTQWKMVKWDTVLSIKNGKSQKNVVAEDGRYPIYGSGGVMGYANDFLCEENTVVLGRKGNINSPIFVKEKFWNVDTAFGLVANKEFLIPKFLYYFCISYNFEKLNTTVTIPSLTKSNLLSVLIPLPPLDIQNQIVAQLDLAQALIDQRKQQLGLMDALIQSTFYEMFGDQANNEKGWDVKPLPFFLSVDTNMIHDFTDYQDYPHIGIDSIEKNTGKIANYRTINEDGVISGKYLFDQRHIIYSKIRPNLNKVALPTFQGLCSADAYPLLVDSSKANRVFVALILRSEHFLNEIMAHCTRTNIPKINKKQLLSFESILPPIDLQNTFSDRVQKFEKIKAQMTASLAELEQNFNALMQQSFAG